MPLTIEDADTDEGLRQKAQGLDRLPLIVTEHNELREGLPETATNERIGHEEGHPPQVDVANDSRVGAELLSQRAQPFLHGLFGLAPRAPEKDDGTPF